MSRPPEPDEVSEPLAYPLTPCEERVVKGLRLLDDDDRDNVSQLLAMALKLKMLGAKRREGKT